MNKLQELNIVVKTTFKLFAKYWTHFAYLTFVVATLCVFSYMSYGTYLYYYEIIFVGIFVMVTFQIYSLYVIYKSDSLDPVIISGIKLIIKEWDIIYKDTKKSHNRNRFIKKHGYICYCPACGTPLNDQATCNVEDDNGIVCYTCNICKDKTVSKWHFGIAPLPIKLPIKRFDENRSGGCTTSKPQNVFNIG